MCTSVAAETQEPDFESQTCVKSWVWQQYIGNRRTEAEELLELVSQHISGRSYLKATGRQWDRRPPDTLLWPLHTCQWHTSVLTHTFGLRVQKAQGLQNSYPQLSVVLPVPRTWEWLSRTMTSKDNLWETLNFNLIATLIQRQHDLYQSQFPHNKWQQNKLD